MLKVKSFCCFFTLKTGGLILGWLALLGNSLDAIISLWWALATAYKPFCGTIHERSDYDYDDLAAKKSKINQKFEQIDECKA